MLQLLGWVPRPCPWLPACGSDGAAAAAPCCPTALRARQRGLLCLLSGEFPAPAFLSLSSPATRVVGWGETSRHSKVCCKKQKMVEGANSVWKSPEATAEQEQDLINHCVAYLWWLLCAHGYFFFSHSVFPDLSWRERVADLSCRCMLILAPIPCLKMTARGASGQLGAEGWV